MTRRRIMFLLFGYYPADPRVRRQAEAMAEEGWAAEVLCTSRDGNPRAWALNGVRVAEIPLQKRRGSPLAYLVQYLRATLRYSQILAHRRDVPDVVQVATLPDFLVAAARPVRRRGAKVILDFHESMPEFFSSKYGGLPGRLAKGFLIWVERWSARQADALMTVNDVIAAHFKQRLGNSPVVIYNSPDETLFGKLRLRPTWKENEHEVVFGYHGTFTRIYGLDLLIDACSILKNAAERKFRVRLIGDGPEAARLKARALARGVSDRIEFVGRVALDEIVAHLELIDAGVVPTRKDPFLNMSLGTKLLEYVHLAKPVVASDLHAVREVFTSERSLYYFEGNSARDLAATMNAVLAASPKEIEERVRCAAREYARVRWTRMRSRYVEVVASLAEAAK